MNCRLIVVLFLTLGICKTPFAQTPGNAPVLLSNMYDSAGYALGVDLATNLKERKMMGLNRTYMKRAMAEFLAGKASLIDENECFIILNDYSSRVKNDSGLVVIPVRPLAGTTKPRTRKVKNKKAKLPVVQEQPIQLTNIADSAGYALGINIGNSLKLQDLTALNIDLFHTAIDHVFYNDSLLIPATKAMSVMMNFAQRMARKKSEAIIQEGETFLAENGKRPEVKTTSSGLQYEVITEGKGAKPIPTDIVICHYRGSLLDSTEFDASYNRNQPLEIGVTRVIKGWQEGLQLMPVGSKYKFYIPYQLAYGLNGSPPVIPGGATLIFEVELLEIKKN